MGARKRFILTPVAVIMLAAVASGPGALNIKGLDDTNMIILLSAVQSALLAVMRMTSGARPEEAFAEATSAMAGRLSADIERRQAQMRMIQRQEAAFKMSPGYIGARYLANDVVPNIADWYTSSISPSLSKAASTAGFMLGLSQ
jgi:hypothetical protein